MSRLKLVHLHSDTLGATPPDSNFEIGEIAVNTNNNDPFIAFKKTDDSFVKIKPISTATSTTSGTVKLYNESTNATDGAYSAGFITQSIANPQTLNNDTSISAYLPYCGAYMLDSGTTITQSFEKNRSFIGTVDIGNNNWNHFLSIRHRNGYGDGNSYGMYIQTSIRNDYPSIYVQKQYGNKWGDKYELITTKNLDSKTSELGYAKGRFFPMSGGYIEGPIRFHGFSDCRISSGDSDSDANVGEKIANIAIKSWYGISFVNTCDGDTYMPTNATSVGIDVRYSIVKAKTFKGNATSSDKVNNALTIGDKSFDGSSAINIDALDCGEF